MVVKNPHTNLVISFRNLHYFHSNATKTWATFWSEVHFKPMTNLELFKCTRSRCKIFPFIHNVKKMLVSKRSIKITDHYTCTSANVIYCITCIYCKKIYIGETGRRLSGRFQEQLRDVERNDLYRNCKLNRPRKID